MRARSHASTRIAATVLAATVALVAPLHARAQTSDDGWNAFLDALAAAGRTVHDNTPEGDGPERAEGYRHLIRLVEFTQSSFLDDADAAHPNVQRCPSKVGSSIVWHMPRTRSSPYGSTSSSAPQ